jgi:cysteinyl-tRNA synthetase
MTLKLFNTLGKNKAAFTPLKAGEVKMYVCGPTVYGRLHIGNFRGAILFNLVRNWLEKLGNKVTYVYNYTDVDDQIIKKANEEKTTATEISERYIKAFEEDFKRLGLKKHEFNPRVTEFMPQIISFIDGLVKNGHAYVVDGEVYYSIEKFKDYGALSGNKLEDLNAGQRVEVDKKKKSPLDFVLWKPAKPNEPFWESPWSKGRPGWHIECSAMIKSILGDTIDIHGGGIDLIFPHHECEIAQGEGLSGKKYCGHWMHNEFLNLNDQKMSKSLGNIMTAQNFMDTYHPEILKYMMLSLHYRSSFNVNNERISNLVLALSRVYASLKNALNLIHDDKLTFGKVDDALSLAIKNADAKMIDSMNDDFNTGEVMSQIFEVVRTFNNLLVTKGKNKNDLKASAQKFADWIKSWGALMSLFQEDPNKFISDLDEMYIRLKGLDKQVIIDKINLRLIARQNKDWAASDKIRDELIAMEIEVFDSPTGMTWQVKRG